MRTDGLARAQGAAPRAGARGAARRSRCGCRSPTGPGWRRSTARARCSRREHGANEVELTVRLDRWQVDRLQEEGVAVVEAGRRRAAQGVGA